MGVPADVSYLLLCVYYILHHHCTLITHTAHDIINRLPIFSISTVLLLTVSLTRHSVPCKLANPLGPSTI